MFNAAGWERGAQKKKDSVTNVVWVLGARQESLFLSPYQGFRELAWPLASDHYTA